VKDQLEKRLPSQRTLLLPLHSLLPTSNQREVFDRPPPGKRKIIISTMIAETSVTIDDVVYVVNSGKTKMKDFDPESNIETLQSKWVSQASARQRCGRAGRVQPGECYHLYTRHHAELLAEYDLPEMLRTRLEKLCLDIKVSCSPCCSVLLIWCFQMLKLGKVVPFISKAMQPPSIDALTSAVNFLEELVRLVSCG
jgi:ATP-dependent RNA helicase DHX36